MRSIFSISSTILSLAVVLAGCAGAASDTESDANGGGGLDSEHTHCTMVASAFSADGKIVSSGDSAPTCFRTFSQAVASATSSRVHLSAEETPATVTEASLNTQDVVVGAGPYVIGIDYVDSNFNGKSLIWLQYAPCSPTVYYASNSMPAGFRDNVSSARAFANCQAKHWEHSNRWGASVIVPRNGALADLGSMGDETLSIEFYY